MRLIFDANDFVRQWVMSHVSAISEKTDPAIGVMDGERLIAGVVYKNFHGHDIEFVLASIDPRWCQRRFLYTFFAYPFLQLGCIRVTAIAAKKNKRSRKLIEGLGFKLEGVIRKGFSTNEDACVYGMLRHECHWVKYGRKISAKKTNAA